MTPHQRRLRLDLAATRYLDALEREDFDAMAELWRQAGEDHDLEEALHELHAGLVEERQIEQARRDAGALAEAVAKHLPSAEIIRPTTDPITVADVAEALFRQPPPRLPPEAHALNEKLRAAREPLPEHLGLSKLITWAEAKFGRAAREYWKAFQQAAIDLELRQASEAEYRMAARPTPRKEGQP